MRLIPLRRKDRDLEEFENLIETHLDGLYRVALRYTRNPSAAEDLVHDTVVRALRFRERFEPGTNFKAWSYTILTNTFIHRYRRQKREREVLEGASRDDVERQLRSEESRQAAQRPEHAYLDHLLSDEVASALDSLPDDYRNVITLCDLEGLSYKEIADVLDCPVGTIMSRLYRGRRILERKLLAVAVERGIVKSEPRAAAVTEMQDAVVDLQRFRRRKDG
ncbi:MAG: sigma-70 family RNA polymerase sigma factor [Myxococcota bacterium]